MTKQAPASNVPALVPWGRGDANATRTLSSSRREQRVTPVSSRTSTGAEDATPLPVGWPPVLTPPEAKETDPNELYTIAYASRMKFKEDVREIIKVSSRNNIQRGISGMLWYEDDTQRVIQILEGPRCHLEALLELLQTDRRHRQMKILYQRALDGERHFPEWGMLYGAAEFLSQVPELVEAIGQNFSERKPFMNITSDGERPKKAKLLSFSTMSSVISRVPRMKTSDGEWRKVKLLSNTSTAASQSPGTGRWRQ